MPGDLATRRAELERAHGPWTAHNIRLAEGVYTIGPEPSGDELKLRRVLQLVSDLARKPLAELRVLDLASLEGMYAIELAAHGAEVVAIEGREANLAKARFAAEALGLDRITWIHGDVRDLSRERHDEFDVVLCLGILYHLDAPDVFSFVERIAEVTRDLVVFDTNVAVHGHERQRWNGADYCGERLAEHDPDAPSKVRLAALWSSLDNPWAFLPTLPSLVNLLARSGFACALEALLPPEPDKPIDRVTIVATKRERVVPRVVPPVPEWGPLPEQRPGPARPGRLRRLAGRLPAPIRTRLRVLFRS